MNCPNCKNTIIQTDQFCAQCGQETADHSKSMSSFLHHFLGDYFTFDSKIFRSLIPLITKPGRLTNEYMIGRRASYIPPLRFYIFISILFFLALNSTADENSSSDADFWNQYFNVYIPRLFFLLLPIFALLMRAFDWGKRKTYIAHFVFSLHFHAFLFLTGTVYLLGSELLESLNFKSAISLLAWIMLLWYLLYLFMAMKNVFKRTFGSTLLRCFLLVLSYCVILVFSALLIVFLFS